MKTREEVLAYGLSFPDTYQDAPFHDTNWQLVRYKGNNIMKWLNEDLLNADIDDVVAAVNDASHDSLWNDESPLWLRPQNKDRETFRADIYKQVVGHTPVERIFEKDGIISTDVFSTYRDGTQIGESAMIVIDSETGEYEKMEVMGKLGYKIETVSVIDE